MKLFVTLVFVVLLGTEWRKRVELTEVGLGSFSCYAIDWGNFDSVMQTRPLLFSSRGAFGFKKRFRFRY